MTEIKESDLYFLKNLQDVINSLNEIDKVIETNAERQQTKDHEQSDILHMFEDLTDETSNNVYVKLGRELTRIRKERRHLKKEFLLIKEYQSIKNRLTSSENRQFVNSSINKKMKEISLPYKFRVLTEEQRKGLLKEPVKMDSLTLNNKILELHSQGLSQTKIGKTLGLSQQSVSMRLKKMKKEN